MVQGPEAGGKESQRKNGEGPTFFPQRSSAKNPGQDKSVKEDRRQQVGSSQVGKDQDLTEAQARSGSGVVIGAGDG